MNCRPKSALYTTSILADYCRLNIAQSTTAQSTGRETGTPTEGGTPSVTVPTSTAGTSAAPTRAPGRDQGGLTADGKAGVIAGSVIGFISIVIMLAGLKLSWYSRARARLVS
jgi:hypothetical protein